MQHIMWKKSYALIQSGVKKKTTYLQIIILYDRLEILILLPKLTVDVDTIRMKITKCHEFRFVQSCVRRVL